MMCGLTNISSGDAIVNGHSVRKEPEKVKASVGVVQDISNLYPELTCFDNLMFSAEMHGVPKRLRKERVLELLEFFDLEDKKDEKFANLFRGLKRRLTIAAALVHKPKILLLDEPTLVLDVKSRRKMWALIKALKEEDITIFLTSHNVYEVSHLSERVAVINKGRIVAEGKPSELKRLVPYDETIELGVSDPKRLLERLKGVDVIDRAYLDKGTLKVVARDSLVAIEEISQVLREEGIDVNFMSLRSADMEEVFLKIVEGEGVGRFKQGDLHSKKDIKEYYMKPATMSWGIIFPASFALAFAIKNGGRLGELAPGLIALALFFGSTSMSAASIVFERKIGSFERLLLFPVSYTTIALGKTLSSFLFGVLSSVVTLAIILPLASSHPPLHPWLLLATYSSRRSPSPPLGCSSLTCSRIPRRR